MKFLNSDDNLFISYRLRQEIINFIPTEVASDNAWNIAKIS